MAEVPWSVGEIVALVPREGSSNGSGDGILWRITKVFAGTHGISSSAQLLRVEPCWCATGDTSLRPKSVRGHEVRERVSFLRLGELRLQLDDLCREALAREAGLPPEFGFGPEECNDED